MPNVNDVVGSIEAGEFDNDELNQILLAVLGTEVSEKSIEDIDEGRTRTMTIKARHVPPGETWMDKDALRALEQECEQYWGKIADEKRHAILVLVRDTLLRLLEDPEEWVPTSMRAQTGGVLEVWVTLQLAEIDDEVLRLRLETERQIHDTRADLVEMRTDLRNKGSEGAEATVAPTEEATADVGGDDT